MNFVDMVYVCVVLLVAALPSVSFLVFLFIAGAGGVTAAVASPRGAWAREEEKTNRDGFEGGEKMCLYGNFHKKEGGRR